MYGMVNLLYIAKYGARVMPTGWWMSIYIIYIVLIWLLYNYRESILEHLNRKTGFALTAVGIAALAALQVQIDPMSLQVDRWSAIHNFLEHLLHGEYPYAAQTHLGGYGSPFPVWQLLHLPFYLLGNVGFSFIACLLLFMDAIRRMYGWLTSVTVFALLLLSPAYIYEVCVRSDLASNFLLSAAVIIYLHQYHVTFSRHWLLLAILCGLMMSTRLSAVIPMAIYYCKDFCRGNIRQQAGFMAITACIFMLTFLPFALWDGKMLLFHEYNPFILQTRQGNLTDLPLLMAAGLGASVWWRGCWDRYLLSVAFCLVTLVGMTFIHNMCTDGSWNQLFSPQYDITYFNMSLPFAVALLASQEKDAAL